MTRTLFTGKSERSKKLLGIIHTDVYLLMTIHAKGGCTYFITSDDDNSRYDYVYFMKHKSESFERFKKFKNEVEKQIRKSIKILLLDWGG